MIEEDLIYILKVGMYENSQKQVSYRRENLENPAWRKIDIWTRNAYLKKIENPKFHLI